MTQYEYALVTRVDWKGSNLPPSQQIDALGTYGAEGWHVVASPDPRWFLMERVKPTVKLPVKTVKSGSGK